MKPTNEEVYNALITLQNLCSETEDCIKCPLWNDKARRCGLKDERPEYWKINCVSKWKAFE